MTRVFELRVSELRVSELRVSELRVSELQFHGIWEIECDEGRRRWRDGRGSVG